MTRTSRRRCCWPKGGLGRFQLQLAWSLLWASIRSRVEVHRFPETFEGMSASFVEAKTRPGDEILDRSGHQHLAGPGERRYARGDVDGDALHVIVGDFDLASMEATANLNVERANRLGNGASAPYGTCGAVEGGEKPAPERFNFA